MCNTVLLRYSNMVHDCVAYRVNARSLRVIFFTMHTNNQICWLAEACKLVFFFEQYPRFCRANLEKPLSSSFSGLPVDCTNCHLDCHSLVTNVRYGPATLKKDGDISLLWCLVLGLLYRT